MDRWFTVSEYDALFECLFDGKSRSSGSRDGEGLDEPRKLDGSELRETVHSQLHG